MSLHDASGKTATGPWAGTIHTRVPSLLVANRGEISARIIRTARRLGIRCVAVHSEADARAPFVRLADEAVCIGPAPARDSYLQGARIIEVARATGAVAIHPGYGFLSENADFAEACDAAGLIFVGPPAAAIRAMGPKDAAKGIAAQAGVPIVPGYHGEDQSADLLAAQAERIGFPLLIKAVAGGGGKGMKRVDDPAEFADALASAQREAMSAFGDARVLIERYVLSPRHVEIQIFADSHGNVVHLFERDCSLQRRHQKVLEEAPAPGMSAEMRAAMGKAAVEAARAVGYVGAGTVEFIADGREGLRPDRFFFMEMNTRLQVEHPVTEAITGLDLVELQLAVAAGWPLPFRQEDLAITGHAVEARLYAEDVPAGFLPSTGRLQALSLPTGEGIRVDAGVEEGSEVTAHYDPMIAKVIAHGPTRDDALNRLSAALATTLVAGPASNVAFLRALCDAPAFRAGQFDTGFISAHLEALGAVPRAADRAAAAAGALWLIEQELASRRGGADHDARDGAAHWRDPWDAGPGSGLAGFGLLTPKPMRFVVDGAAMTFAVRFDADGPVMADADLAAESARAPVTIVLAGDDVGDGVIVVRDGHQTRVSPSDPLSVDPDAAGQNDAGADGRMAVRSPLHGKLVALFVAEGDAVERGARLAIVEAMKMEHVLTAPRAGIVTDIGAEAGAQVAQGARLMVLTADSSGGTTDVTPR